jgi:hypothetical protein
MNDPADRRGQRLVLALAAVAAAVETVDHP